MSDKIKHLPAGFVPVPPEMMSAHPQEGLAAYWSASGGWMIWSLDSSESFLLPKPDAPSCKGCKFWVRIGGSDWGTCNTKAGDRGIYAYAFSERGDAVLRTYGSFACNQFAAVPKCDKCGRAL